MNGTYLAKLCANDWGIYKTFTDNLVRVKRLLEKGFVREEDYPIVASNLAQIYEAIQSAEKSPRWKIRAKIGEKRRWYEIPDQTDSSLSRKIPGET